ncbi:hypothetical protein [Nocardioides marmorisolisilvae]|uniref:Pentapeptide repeat-containing protein n=1 Tax=Nocardioides marmorisolisilvae TaxID=1542737 RepID=A0A3N0DS32_9ACTN|nr:hypothetical protein [Nocardioides marmorisolisilvae]RNL78296.1 hypothetical protein EFL95_04090 [Nocardioides marmorisolisilvae]
MKPTTRAVLPAYLMAGAALFFAVGGPAYASTLITGANIKDSSVTGADIQNGSLTGSDVKSSSLTGTQVKDGGLTGKDVHDGSIGMADLSPGTQAALTTSACPAGQVLRWTSLNATNGTFTSADHFRIGRCYGTGPAVKADGILQDPEQCDDGNLVGGDGCDSNMNWEGPESLNTKLP